MPNKNRGNITFERRVTTGNLTWTLHIEIPEHEKVVYGCGTWIFRQKGEIIDKTRNYSEHGEYAECFQAMSEKLREWAERIREVVCNIQENKDRS